MLEEKSKELPHALRQVIVTDVITVKENQNVGDVFPLLKKDVLIDYVYVLDAKGKFVGVFSIKKIFHCSKKTSVKNIMNRDIVQASPKMDIERIAHLALRHQLKAIPIVADGKLVGVVPPGKITAILNNALRTDLFHFAGIHRSHLDFENSLTTPILRSIAHRTPWLIIGMIGIVIVAVFIGMFQRVLEKHIILAFFMPAILYLSNALGTQDQALFIRDLAVMGDELKLHKYLVRQALTSILIAMVIGTLMFFAVALIWRELHIAFVISFAVFASLGVTTVTSYLVTIVLKKIGYDPALGGGPFATIISDATSVMIYFVVATMML